MSRDRAITRSARTPSAQEGIQLLKDGCEAIKYSRTGKPRTTKFRLSEDEQTLSWDSAHHGVTAPLKMARGERRNVKITEILDLLLGMESKIFLLHKEELGLANHNHPMAHV